jgi:hypothetical protein
MSLIPPPTLDGDSNDHVFFTVPSCSLIETFSVCELKNLCTDLTRDQCQNFLNESPAYTPSTSCTWDVCLLNTIMLFFLSSDIDILRVTSTVDTGFSDLYKGW